MSLPQSAKRLAGLKLLVQGLVHDQLFPAVLPAYQRTVYFLGGPVALSVPIVVLYSGKRRRALDLVARLKRNGYSRVKLQRERHKRETKPKEQLA